MSADHRPLALYEWARILMNLAMLALVTGDRHGLETCFEQIDAIADKHNHFTITTDGEPTWLKHLNENR